MSNNNERYPDWFLSNPRIAEDLDSYSFDIGEMAWNHQQKKIDELEKELAVFRNENKFFNVYSENLKLVEKLQAEREKVKNIEFKLDVFGGNLLLSGERRALEMFREFRQALEKLKESEGEE